MHYKTDAFLTYASLGWLFHPVGTPDAEQTRCELCPKDASDVPILNQCVVQKDVVRMANRSELEPPRSEHTIIHERSDSDTVS